MRDKESGQALVEFAFVFLILILIVIGTIDVGKTIYMEMNINLLSQESVRLGSLGYDDEYINEYINDNFKLGETSKLTRTITPDYATRESGDYLNIELKYEMDYFMPGIGFVLPEEVDTSATSRVE